MAQQKSRRASRKRQRRTTTPRAVVSTRRDERAERRAEVTRELRRGNRQLGTEGERPQGPFGGLPVSELAILIGLVGLAVGFIQGGGPVVIVSVIVLGGGVLEVTGREHFAGYRSHTILLSAVPALMLETIVVTIFGVPNQRALLLIPVVPLYAVLFWLLRRKFMSARQARVARPPAP